MASLLVDEGIGQDLVQALAGQGFAIFHVLEFLPKGAKDSLVFLEAQTRSLTIFTWNRDDFVLLGYAWRHWGHGNHHGIISRPKGLSQLHPPQTLPVLERYCRDTSSFVNRVELF